VFPFGRATLNAWAAFKYAFKYAFRVLVCKHVTSEEDEVKESRRRGIGGWHVWWLEILHVFEMR
jgi:hypothetical protein